VNASARPPRSTRVDWAFAIGGLWIIVGLFNDAVWHMRNEEDSFLTWSHAALYAGLLYSFVAIAVVAYGNIRRGYAPKASLPEGYEFTVPGALLFLVAGVLDGIGHTLWGFESGFLALMAPTHQAIGLSIIMLLIGPIRSILRVSGPNPPMLPALLSLGALMGLLRWEFAPFYHPYAELANAAPSLPGTHDAINTQSMSFALQEHGLASVFVATMLMVAFSLYIARTLRPRPGAITLVLLIGNGMASLAVGVEWLQGLIPIAATIVAGLFGDWFLRDPLALDRDPRRLAWLAFGIPFLYHAVVIGLTAATGGTWWQPIFIFGSLIYSGMFGFLLSLVVTARARSL
jgi:hypothetical protein